MCVRALSPYSNVEKARDGGVYLKMVKPVLSLLLTVFHFSLQESPKKQQVFKGRGIVYYVSEPTVSVGSLLHGGQSEKHCAMLSENKDKATELQLCCPPDRGVGLVGLSQRQRVSAWWSCHHMASLSSQRSTPHEITGSHPTTAGILPLPDCWCCC